MELIVKRVIAIGMLASSLIVGHAQTVAGSADNAQPVMTAAVDR